MIRVDADGDGVLNYDEFIACAIDYQDSVNQKHIDGLFDMIDVDQDGGLTK